MSYPLDKKTQIHSEFALLMPRLASFAAALTGSESASNALLKATRNHVATRAKDRGHTPMALWTFGVMHTLWAARIKGAQGDQPGAADAKLFQPRGSAGGEPSGAGRMARFVAQLPPLQRATLHLVYGERLSYDETAEVFGVPVATVMTRLVRAHAALSQRQDAAAPFPVAAAAQRPVEQGREWIAA